MQNDRLCNNSRKGRSTTGFYYVRNRSRLVRNDENSGKSGLLSALSRQMYPVIGKLFPDIPKNSSALKNITANITANIFGLGWAATPAGINAMKDMSKLNGYKKTASKSMCMFMVINMSSVQLITINIIAYRSQFGSSAPASVIFPGIIATAISTVVGIAAVKAAERLVKI